ncbi:hypothetical protein JAAARDRAFT_28384 [Jaapia argillacea MUCL 33604]|uniref:DUF6593 domain-containing protein n=1 Tax=Jaapia argillacea MUCL 33604 TaxID=933084 RepID=A0A067QCP3_9AGAM|nr:hypothetical protein JAAARDRAFT_28384 [Jaapia argillacea MUCL 33604]
MTAPDIVLRFVYQPPGSNSDIRTFRVHHLQEGSENYFELYKFYHPITGMTSGSTTFHRKNRATLVWEPAGQIEWSSNSNAMIQFGIDEVSIRDLRRAKKSSSKSRRFKAGGSEYKWKVDDNGTDLFCVDSWGKVVATWSQEDLTLRVASQVEGILDRVVVTCLINLWIRQLGFW